MGKGQSRHREELLQRPCGGNELPRFEAHMSRGQRTGGRATGVGAQQDRLRNPTEPRGLQ